MTNKSSITIPNSSITIELDKDQIYKLFGELYKHLARDYDEYGYYINAHTVIARIDDIHNDDATYFLSLDRDTQLSIASDTLNDTFNAYFPKNTYVGFNDIVDEILTVAAHAAIKVCYRY